MKYFKHTFVLFFSLLLFLGCTPKAVVQKEVVEVFPLTSEVVNNTLNEAELKGLQVYTSHEIILHKQSSDKVTKVQDGKLIYNTKSDLNQIVVKPKTPCTIAEFDKENDLIVVEFEDGIKLSFSTSKRNCCQNKGKYYFSADFWIANEGSLKLGGINYRAIGTSGNSYLMVAKEFLQNQSSQVKHLKGKLIEKKRS